MQINRNISNGDRRANIELVEGLKGMKAMPEFERVNEKLCSLRKWEKQFEW